MSNINNTTSNAIDYAGNPIQDPETNAVRLAGSTERWAHRDDENITRIEGNDHEYSLREEAHEDAVTGDMMHESNLRYVPFNDAYTSSAHAHTLYRRSMEYIPECSDHVEDEGGNDCHEDDVADCNDCGDTHHHDHLDSRGYCSSCEDDHNSDGDASCLQGYHEHGLGDTIQVIDELEPSLRKKHLQKYTVGFEVEKSTRQWREGDPVPQTPLFAYWETDGSCGIEGITHAYSLGSAHVFHAHVSASSNMVNLESNNNCGGHFSLKGPKVSRNTVRNYLGLLYAIYRNRLTNSYCCEDPRILSTYDYRYSPVRTRRSPDSNGVGFVEYRLPRAVENATQLRNRFELAQLVADAIHEDKTFKQYLRSNAPLLRRIYPDATKRKEIYAMAHHFQKWVESGERHESIRQWATTL